MPADHCHPVAAAVKEFPAIARSGSRPGIAAGGNAAARRAWRDGLAAGFLPAYKHPRPDA